MAFEIKRNKRKQKKREEKGRTKTLSPFVFGPRGPTKLSLLSPCPDLAFGPSWPATGPTTTPLASAQCAV